MRFLHTSDWHVGRMIRSRSREAEHGAALQQLLTYAREHAIDALLIAGDIFDTASPSAEAERLVYDFFRELHGAGIPAVVIAGNHDHPRRFEAIAPLLRTVNIHAVGEPRSAGEGGVIEIASRDGRETAIVAALPWVTDRRAVDFATLQQGPAAALLSYADQVASAMNALSDSFRPDSVNLLMAHALVNDAVVGPPKSGGERELHLAMGVYGVQRQRFPATAQYVALGHVHRPQEIAKSPAAWYSGSLLQLDFGEVEQAKSVNLIEVHARQPADVTSLPIDKGVRRLVDIGTPFHGVGLNELASYAGPAGDAWLRVFVDLDLPVANLPAVVRDQLPNAVHVQRVPANQSPVAAPQASALPAGPEEQFGAFYRSSLGRGAEVSAATLTLFRRLLEEEADAAADT
jgi:exonuclease SbcD